MSGMFIVCHMLASLDGKIDGAFFAAPETPPALQAYGNLREYYHCSATLYGATTMLGGYSDGKVQDLPAGEPLPQEDWVSPAGKELGNFIVSVDPKGELAFSAGVLEKKGRAPAHVIEALTRQARPEYLSYLRERGVSYVFAGEETLDCGLLLEKLSHLFQIDRLMVAGGGLVNWSFLAAGLVDEMSLVIAPVADGSTTAVSICEAGSFLPPHGPVGLKLLDCKPLDGDALWLRYAPKK